MAFAVSTSLGHAGVVGKVDDGSYIGLRPSTTRKLSLSLCRIGARGHTAIRASEDRSASLRTSGLSNEECEAAAVAGKFPAPPPFVRPAGPQGTPKITPLVSPPFKYIYIYICSHV